MFDTKLVEIIQEFDTGWRSYQIEFEAPSFRTLTSLKASTLSINFCKTVHCYVKVM